MALTKTVQYYLARFGLTLSHRGTVDGATYTDVKAQLPALNLLMLISVAAAILFILNIFRKVGSSRSSRSGCGASSRSSSARSIRRSSNGFVVQPNEYARADLHQAQHRRDAHRVRARQDHNEAIRLQHRSHVGGRRQPNNGDAPNARALGSEAAGPGALGDRGAAAYFSSPMSTSTATTSGATETTSAACASSTRRSCRATRGRTATSCTRTATASTPRRRTRTTATRPTTCSPTSLRSRRMASKPLAARRLLRRGAHRLFGRRQQGRRARGERRGASETAILRQRRREGEEPCPPARVALRFGDFNLVYSGQVTGELAHPLSA